MPPPETAESDCSRQPGATPTKGTPSSWDALSADSHRAEAQEMIRRQIREGTIRVSPIPGCPDHVRIFRVSPSEANTPPSPG